MPCPCPTILWIWCVSVSVSVSVSCQVSVSVLLSIKQIVANFLHRFKKLNLHQIIVNIGKWIIIYICKCDFILVILIRAHCVFWDIRRSNISLIITTSRCTNMVLSIQIGLTKFYKKFGLKLLMVDIVMGIWTWA